MVKRILSEPGSYKITVNFEEKWAHILNDDALKAFYNEYEQAGIARLSLDILINYKEIFKKPLYITPQSLMVEIIAHLDVESIASKFPIVKNYVTSHTKIIDCGEEDVDNNRWLWDLISKSF
jgi:hypothetical protein